MSGQITVLINKHSQYNNKVYIRFLFIKYNSLSQKTQTKSIISMENVENIDAVDAVVDDNLTSSTNTDSALTLQKPPFINAPDLPTQVHPSGVRIDLN